jgi:serine/threonine protein kinase
MPFPPREIPILKKLHHPYICKLLDLIELPDRIHLILEQVQGAELFGLLEKNKKFSEVETRKYFRQLCEALVYIHSKKVVHRVRQLNPIL